jgi:hypothetical protein
MKIKCIHYGDSSFDLGKFSSPKNNSFGWERKPFGGLWASPVDSQDGWKEWCISEEFHTELLEVSFEFIVDGNVAIIDSLDDLMKLPLNRYSSIDFEKLLEDGVDAIWLTDNGQWDTRLSTPADLYGWDCESVLVLNPRCIKEGE